MRKLRGIDRPASASRALALALATLVLASCYSGRVRTREATDSEGSSYGTDISVTGNRAQAHVERAKQAAMDGQFVEAKLLLEGVYEDRSAEDDVRAEALYELGRLDTNLLNQRRDSAQALSTFEKLLDEFPRWPRRAEAEQQIEYLRASGPSR